jgi:pimeloyl-ACP methyl ester carboxylesterase
MVPEEIYYLLPDVWNNVEAVRAMELPLLVIHGTEDRVVPPEMGRKVAEAGGGQYQLLEGVGHRQLVRHPTTELWKPIIEAIYKVQN